MATALAGRTTVIRSSMHRHAHKAANVLRTRSLAQHTTRGIATRYTALLIMFNVVVIHRHVTRDINVTKPPSTRLQVASEMVINMASSQRRTLQPRQRRSRRNNECQYQLVTRRVNTIVNNNRTSRLTRRTSYTATE